MSCEPSTTHAQREDALTATLLGMHGPGRRTLQEGKKKHTIHQPWSSEKKKREQQWAKWHAENGMNSHGLVQKCTPVVFDHLPKGNQFEQHPFFHKILRAAIRTNVKEHWLDQLREIEKEAHQISMSTSVNAVGHRHGANEGFNVGLSVCPGYPHGDKEKGISGSVQWAEMVKSRPHLRSKLIHCLTQLLHSICGKEAWFKRLLHLTTKLNADTGETRTVPSLPLSGLWLTQNPKPEGVHCDRNVVGATFLLTTSNAKGAVLLLLSPTGKLIKHQLKPGQILAGSWANHAHCNSQVVQSEFRTSWTLYLDKRVFSKRYICALPKGHAE